MPAYLEFPSTDQSQSLTYIEMHQPLTAFDATEQLDEQYHSPELLIENRVPHSPVTEILFRKLIQ